MKVKQDKINECDLQLDDITAEEFQALFLAGIKSLVNEARSGNVGEYIVLPYKNTPALASGPNIYTIKIDDDDADALAQIGAANLIIKSLGEDSSKAHRSRPYSRLPVKNTRLSRNRGSKLIHK